MGFFKDIYERIGDYTLNLCITKDKGQLVVMLVPKLEAKNDDSLKEIIPLTVKGTPDQLDAGFILAISQGIQMTTGLQTNIKEFEAGLKKAEKKVKGKNDKKESVNTNTTDNDIKTDNDQMPFDADDVDPDTGEIKEEKPADAKEEKKVKPAEPKAKTAEPKAKKEPETKAEKINLAATPGEITENKDDNDW